MFFTEKELRGFIARSTAKICHSPMNRIDLPLPRGKELDEKQFDQVHMWAKSLKKLGLFSKCIVCHDGILVKREGV